MAKTLFIVVFVAFVAASVFICTESKEENISAIKCWSNNGRIVKINGTDCKCSGRGKANCPDATPTPTPGPVTDSTAQETSSSSSGESTEGANDRSSGSSFSTSETSSFT